MIYAGYAFLAVFLFMYILQFLALTLERRMVWPYSDLQDSPTHVDTSGYLTRTINDARNCGFRLLGYTHDLKGETYKITYAFLITTDQKALAMIGSGTLLKMSLETVWIYSQTSDQKLCISVNKQQGAEMDLSRMSQNQLIPEAGFRELYDSHMDWLKNSRVESTGFGKGVELTEMLSFRHNRFMQMAKSGFIRFTNPESTRWKYTLYGACRYLLKDAVVGIPRAFTKGKFPRIA